MRLVAKLKLEKQIATIEAEIAQHRANPKGLELRQRIEDAILKRHIQSIPKDEATRRAFLSSQVATYRDRLRREIQNRLGGAGMVSAIDQIFAMYAGFDIQAFKTDFDELFREELQDARCAIDSLESQIAAIREEIKKKWNEKSVLGSFKRVPDVWRDFAVGKHCTPFQMAEHVLTMFLKDWTYRVQFFAEPVTITGVSIGKMPDQHKTPWAALYAELGFATMRKQVEFLALTPDFEEPQAAKKASTFRGPRDEREAAAISSAKATGKAGGTGSDSLNDPDL